MYFSDKISPSMKIVLRIILLAVIGLIGYGYYINLEHAGDGEKFIGFGVVLFAFILMPLFIYHRYKGKDLRNYSFKDFANPPDKEKED